MRYKRKHSHGFTGGQAVASVSYPIGQAFGKLTNHMLESHPSYSPGNVFGYVLLSGIILLDIALLWLLFLEPITILSFLWGLLLAVSLPATAFIAYTVSQLSRMRYHVAGGALLVEWGHICQVIPLAQIRMLIPGETLETISAFRGIRWPGCFIGRGRVSGIEPETGKTINCDTVFYATRPLSQQLLLVTDSQAYGISPVDLKTFADCLAALRLTNTGGPAGVPPSRLSFLTWPIWQDRLAQMMLAMAATLNALLFAYLYTIYGRLPAFVPLHFNESGVADRVDSPANLFILPVAGLLVWLLNGVLGWIFYHWRDEPPLAFILWGGAIVMQLAAWAAILVLLA